MNRDQVTVAYMLNQFGVGGADRQLLELLKRLDRSRYRPLLYLGSASGFVTEELHDLGIPVRFVRGHGGSKFSAGTLAAEFRRERPEVIHSWMFVANTWGRIAGRLARVPVIITSDRGMDTDLPSMYRWIDVALSPLSLRVIVNADAVAENVHRTRYVPRSKIVTIYNGVDLDVYGKPVDRLEARRLLDLPPEVAVIGMVASFSTRKRWDVFLDTVAEVARRRPIIAACVGDGGLRPAMEEYAREKGLQDVARFYGVRSDIAEVMAALDVFVLSSDDEGMPNVVMQAMAARRPVVATDAGGTREIVVEGQTGYVVPLRDVGGLLDRIDALLDDGAKAREFGEAGRRRVERHFTFDTCVARTTGLYETLLERKGLGRSAAVGEVASG